MSGVTWLNNLFRECLADKFNDLCIKIPLDLIWKQPIIRIKAFLRVREPLWKQMFDSISNRMSKIEEFIGVHDEQHRISRSTGEEKNIPP